MAIILSSKIIHGTYQIRQEAKAAVKKTFIVKMWLPKNVNVVRASNANQWTSLNQPGIQWIDLPFDTYKGIDNNNSFHSIVLIDDKGKMTYATRQESLVLSTKVDVAESQKYAHKIESITVSKPEYLGDGTFKFNLNELDSSELFISTFFGSVIGTIFFSIGCLGLLFTLRNRDKSDNI